MESKIMQIFYGNDCLPFKDKERQVHFPVIGNSFAGASKTTEIRFYVKDIGGVDSISWVANTKRADGSIGYQLLSSRFDSEIGEYYVYLELSQWYTEKVGDLYITLNGYDGSSEIEVDEDSGLFTVSGNPIIQATGSVKITIAYATQMNNGYGSVPEITVQTALALVASKLDKNSGYYVKVVDSISNINSPTYANILKDGDIVFSIGTLYVLSGTHPTLTYAELPIFIANLTTDDLKVQNELRVDSGTTYLTLDSNGNVSLQDYLDEKQNQIAVVELATQSGTIASAYMPSLSLYPSYLFYSGNLFVHCSEDSTYHYFKKLFETNIIDNNTNLVYGEVWVRVNKTSRVYDTQLKQTLFYSKDESDDLLNLKADKSDTYTKSEVNSYLSLKADKSNTYTKTEVDNAISSAVASAYKYKGSVANYSSLPSSGNEVGDVWNVEDTGDNYAWTGSEWDKLSGTVDLSGYLEKSSTNSSVYATTNNGSQTMVSYGSAVSNGSLVQRDANGQVLVPTAPTNNSHSTSKSYVDSGLATKVNKSTTVAGISLSANISAQDLTNALVYMNNTTDMDYVMGE